MAADTDRSKKISDADHQDKPDAAQTDHPTGEDQAAANAEDEPAG